MLLYSFSYLCVSDLIRITIFFKFYFKIVAKVEKIVLH